MKYLVMENHESHSIIMDENGLFYRAANLGYEIGETVTDPVFMKTPERKKKYNWKKVATVAAIFMCLLMTSIPFINNSTESDVVVYMSINPQIHLELNDDGKINKLVADNKDGKVLLDDYKYRGKSAAVVLRELIDRAESLKYLSEGGNIHITVEAEDETKAKNVEVDLSQALKETYVKKYMIKIKANEESFRKLEDVLNTGGATLPRETEQMTSESTAADNYYRPTEKYTETTQASESTSESITEPATESQKATTQPTESSKPAVKPTEATTTEETTEASSETEPSDGQEDDDFFWPWWP